MHPIPDVVDVCDATHARLQEGFISSPSYPHLNRDDVRESCIFQITPLSENATIQIRLYDLDLPTSGDSRCDDSLTILSSKPSALAYTVCGALDDSSLALSPGVNTLALNFSSNSNLLSAARGFLLYFRGNF